MANSFLTPTVITKEALMILHQKLKFVGSINRGYDDRFAKSGAKIGDTLTIRKPNEFTVRSGRTLNTQDVTEQSLTLQVNNQKGVDWEFNADDLTLTIDEFSERYLEPAMAKLAAEVENDVLTNVYKDVYQFHDGVDAANDFNNVTAAGVILDNALAPDSQRTMLHGSQGMADLINSNKDLFHDSKELSRQYKEAVMGRFGGFDHMASTLVPSHTTGAAAEGDTSWNINNGSDEAATAAEIAADVQTLTVDTGTKTLKVGDILTIGTGSNAVNRVHPETKQNTGKLQQFVVVGNGTTGEDLTSGDTSLQISPPIITSGPRQNVNQAAKDDEPINKVGGGADADWEQTLAYHKNAFTFATADLVLPKGVDMASRQVMDGISMRLIRDYDITNDAFPIRLDVLYGYKTIRPQLAARIGIN